MIRLVADLGGTNCRFALRDDAGGSADRDGAFRHLRNYANSEFASFDALLQHYLASLDSPNIDELVLAVAGPVHTSDQDQTAQITNRNWHLSAQKLTAGFNIGRVALLNDLSALGHALTYLGPTRIKGLIGTVETRQGQNLIVGIGTGFNVSPTLSGPSGTLCLAAEMGHVALPLDIHRMLKTRIGSQADAFQTVECCFSGRGLAALYAACTPAAPPLGAAKIMQNFTQHHQNAPAAPAQTDSSQTDSPAQQADIERFVRFYAQLLALLTRSLLKTYMPRAGIVFAGSVARSLLSSPAVGDFSQTYSLPDPKLAGLSAPVGYILDDAAALIGCAQFRF